MGSQGYHFVLDSRGSRFLESKEIGSSQDLTCGLRYDGFELQYVMMLVYFDFP
jgi:hypothetical protein